MNRGEELIQRKIISASISGALFAILLGFIMPNPFGEQIAAERNYFYSAITIMLLYVMYSFPVIFFYGGITSLLSDKVAQRISKRGRWEFILSAVLHILFGLVLLPFSLGASILFFATDRLMKKLNCHFNWLQTLASLLLPLLVWGISLSVVWAEHFIQHS